MKPAPLPQNEDERLKALQSYDLLDAEREEMYDDITRLASEICRTPISLISLIDKDRQWLLSRHRLDADETSRDVSFCAHAILNPNEPFVVPDSREDKRFADNPLVTGETNVIFYAGMPLVDDDGYALGSLCVIDNRPRHLTDNQLLSLKALSKLVTAYFNARRQAKEIEAAQQAQAELRNVLASTIRPALQTLVEDLDAISADVPAAAERLAPIREGAQTIRIEINRVLLGS